MIYLLAICAVSTLFASNMVIAKWSAGLAPPFGMAFWRWLITASFLLAFYNKELRRHGNVIVMNLPGIFICGFLGMGLCGAPIYIAAHTTSAINIGFIMSASPIVVIVYMAVSGQESFTKRMGFSLAFCVAGVVIILSQGSVTSLLATRLSFGDIIVVGSMLGWAAYTATQGKVLKELSVGAKVCLFALVGVALNFPFYLFELFTEPTAAFSYDLAEIFIFVGVLPGLLAYWLYAKLIETIGAARTSLMMYFIPVVNLILAIIVLGENFEIWHMIGACCILAGLVTSRSRKTTGQISNTAENRPSEG